jgi:hypothetical protein
MKLNAFLVNHSPKNASLKCSRISESGTKLISNAFGYSGILDNQFFKFDLKFGEYISPSIAAMC